MLERYQTTMQSEHAILHEAVGSTAAWQLLAAGQAVDPRPILYAGPHDLPHQQGPDMQGQVGMLDTTYALCCAVKQAACCAHHAVGQRVEHGGHAVPPHASRGPRRSLWQAHPLSPLHSGSPHDHILSNAMQTQAWATAACDQPTGRSIKFAQAVRANMLATAAGSFRHVAGGFCFRICVGPSHQRRARSCRRHTFTVRALGLRACWHCLRTANSGGPSCTMDCRTAEK